MVRVRFGAGGICGSDLHYFQHGGAGDFRVTEALVLGHEIAGEAAEMAGPAPGLHIGDRVAVNPSRWCGVCSYCREGRENLCENIFFMGSASKSPHMQGGFASFIDVVPGQCVKVPQHVSYVAAAHAEPLAVALHAGGTLVQVGNLPGGSIAMPANAVMAKELSVHGTFRFGREYDRAVGLIVTGQVDVIPLVTARMRRRTKS